MCASSLRSASRKMRETCAVIVWCRRAPLEVVGRTREDREQLRIG